PLSFASAVRDPPSRTSSMTGSPAGPSIGTRSWGMASAGSGTVTLRLGTRIVAFFITGQYSSMTSVGDSVIPGLRVSGQGVIDQVHHVRLLMLGEAHEPIFCRLRCPGCCQWALQNQPLMGASKPATSFRGSRSHSHSTHLRFLFKASGTDSAFFSRPRRGPHVGTTSRQTIAPPGANRTPIASSLPLVRALRAGGRFGRFLTV